MVNKRVFKVALAVFTVISFLFLTGIAFTQVSSPGKGKSSPKLDGMVERGGQIGPTDTMRDTKPSPKADTAFPKVEINSDKKIEPGDNFQPKR